MISLKLEGLEGLQAQLAELEAVAAARALRRAARVALAPVLETARQLVPVDTGLTRDHITITSEKGGDGDTVVRVGLKVKAFKGAAKFGRKTASPHWRWRFVELGTVKMAAHPFFRPAMDQNAARVVDLFRDEMLKGIERALKRQRKKRG